MIDIDHVEGHVAYEKLRCRIVIAKVPIVGRAEPVFEGRIPGLMLCVVNLPFSGHSEQNLLSIAGGLER